MMHFRKNSHSFSYLFLGFAEMPRYGKIEDVGMLLAIGSSLEDTQTFVGMLDHLPSKRVHPGAQCLDSGVSSRCIEIPEKAFRLLWRKRRKKCIGEDIKNVHKWLTFLLFF